MKKNSACDPPTPVKTAFSSEVSVHSFFFIFGKSLGNFLFHSETAGIYIRNVSFYLPFLYTKYCTGKYSERSRAPRCLPISQYCRSVYPNWICFLFLFLCLESVDIFTECSFQLILTLLHFIYLNRLEHV